MNNCIYDKTIIRHRSFPANYGNDVSECVLLNTIERQDVKRSTQTSEATARTPTTSDVELAGMFEQDLEVYALRQ